MRIHPSPSVSLKLLFVILFLVFGLSVAGTSLATDPQNTITKVLFGPERFNYSSSTYNRSFNCPSTQGSFSINVVNGNGAGSNAVSSAVVKINNLQVIGTGDLGSKTKQVTKSVTNLVAGNNTMTVKLTGSSSSYVTVKITGVYNLDVRITSPSAGATIGGRSTAVQGTYASYSGNFTVKVNNVAASASNGSFSVASVPLGAGSNLLQAVITTTDNLVDQDNVNINSNLPPVAEAGAAQTVRVGDNVWLDGRYSTDPEGALISYRWTLPGRPQGSASSLQNPNSVSPSFVPDLSGDFRAQLIVNDGVFDSPPDNVVITANHPNTPPTVSAGPDQNVNTGMRVYLDGSGSSDPDSDPLTYSWSFIALPQDSFAVLDNAASSISSFVPDHDGVYIASLVVSDGLAQASDNATIVATTPNAIPTASAGPDQTVPRSSVIHLDGTGSFDPEGAPLSWLWNIVSRPAASGSELDNVSSPTPSLTADAEGDYVVRLVVNDGLANSNPDTVVATSVNVPPVAVATAAPATLPRGSMTTLDGSGSLDDNGDPLSFFWSVVSAPAGSVASVFNAGSALASFTPDKSGSYTIRLVVNDGRVDSAPSDLPITATPLYVIVPDVVLQPQAGAQSGIVGAGLAVGALTGSSSDNVAAGLVLSQSPAAGSFVPEGSPVALTVSTGPRMVTVPDVRGMTQASSQTAIAAADLLVGSVSNGYSGTVPAGSVMGQSPAGGTSVVHGTPVDIVVSQGPAMVVVPNLLGMTQAQAQSALVPVALALGSVTTAYSETVAEGRILSQNPKGGVTAPQDSSVAVVVSLGAEPVTVPPDPATVAPPIDPTVATSLAGAASFLYTGSSPIQTGVAAGTIDPVRISVLRGKVTAVDNTPLSGVRVTILSRPEFGRTVTRDDGLFDMAVNGGGTLTVNFAKAGYIPVQRQANARWGDYVMVDDVVMIPYDAQATAIDLAQPIPVQVARGSAVSDEDGARQMTLLFAQGTQAQMVFPDNSVRPLTSLTVRATEYSVGPNGKKAMPAPLPPTSGYTYCAELSVDEAVAAGAGSVTFSKPVVHYVDNFIGFPVGTWVPVGFYDRKKGQWIPSKDGKVIKILSITGGLANLDTDGNGLADNATILSALGIDDAERAQLATLYPAGKTLWRVSLPHFSTVDYNYPLSALPGAVAPAVGSPQTYMPATNGCTTSGSVIECQNQVLGEDAGIAGTPYAMSYRSDRVAGRKDAYTMKINLTGATLPPPGALGIDLKIDVAGRSIMQRFTNPVPNQQVEFTWDGKDAYGRTVQGAQPIRIAVWYVYPGAYYAAAGGGGSSFGATAGSTTILANARDEAYMSQAWDTSIGAWDTRAGLGGWDLSVHHSYDPGRRTLYLGDGSRRIAEDKSKVVTTIAGTHPVAGGYNGDNIPAKQAFLYYPRGLAVGADGSVYVADYYNNRVRKVGPNGIITTVAGNGVRGNAGDGGQATNAQLNFPSGVAITPDGVLYIADTSNGRVRRVGTDNIITTVAGGGTISPDNYNYPIPVDNTSIGQITRVAVGPDGSIYMTDQTATVVRRIGTDRYISTFAGIACVPQLCSLVPFGDGVFRTSSRLIWPCDVAVAPDGSVYIADWNAMRKVGTDGYIQKVSGPPRGSGFSFNGDGIPASQSSMSSVGIAFAPDGSYFVLDTVNNRIRLVGTDGMMTTLAGVGIMNTQIVGDYLTDGLPAAQTGIYTILNSGIAVGPEGSVYYTDGAWIRKISPSMPGLSLAETPISSEDGSQLYIFNASGKHLRTVDTLTRAVLHRFEYTSTGLLSAVYDADNNVTTIERDPSSGFPQAILAPGGQRTTFTPDPNGYLASISDPGGNTLSFTYTADGLMTRMLDANGNPHDFRYDAMGRLERDDDPEGGFTILSRVDNSTSGYTVTKSTSLWRPGSYLVERLPSGVEHRLNSFPSGARSESFSAPDGSDNTVSPDGTRTASALGPDPRFGMQAPIVKSMTLSTPGGLLSSVSATRTAVLSNSADPLSLTSQTDTVTVNGKRLTQLFDAATRKFTTTSFGNRKTVTGIDNAGRVKLVSVAPTVDNVVYFYDGKGRLDNVVQGGSLWKFGYDPMYRLTSVTDPQRHAVVYGYDNADRVSLVTLPSGRSYGFGYDAAGNRTSITMPSGSVHTLGYTRIDLDNSYIPPDNGNLAYSAGYNTERAWKRTQLPSGRAMDGGYDGDDRLRTMIYPEASVSFGYTDNTDRAGTITRTSSDNATAQTMAISYDAFLPTRVAFGGPSTGEYRYAYDNNFRVRSVTLDNAITTTLAYDNDSLLTQYGRYGIDRSGPAGAPSSLTDNTLNVGYTYDNFGRLATRTHMIAGQQRYQITLGYDNVGRIARKTEVVAGTSHIFDFGYDLDGQLVDVFKDGSLVEHYTFDNNSNRTSTLAANATYDAQDRLIQQGGVSYTFDVDGYLTQRGADTFSYSARGELLSGTAGGQTITYQYDAMARRVARTAAGATTQYLYGNPGQPFQLTASRAPDNTLTTYFYEASGNLFAFERSGQRYYVATDHLGTPKIVTDNAGNVVKQAEYDAWGVKLSDTNPTFDLSVGFAGGIPESTTGLLRFGFRDYEPQGGRWVARDPILFEGGQGNLFTYTSNDPVNFVDPVGLVQANLVKFGDPNYFSSWFIPNSPKVYFIFSHGTDQYINKMNAKEFAGWLRSHGWKEKMPVVLDACRTGEGPNPVGKQLARELNTDVYAPNTRIWTVPFTPLRLGAFETWIEFGKYGIPNFFKLGEFKKF